MKFLSALVQKLSPKRDPGVLFVTIDELPNPRDWGIVDFIVGNKLIFSEDIDLRPMDPFYRIRFHDGTHFD